MEFELEGSARSVVYFEGVLPEAALYVAYAPLDLDRQVSIVVEVAPESNELVRLVAHLANSLHVARQWAPASPLCLNT